MSTEITVDRDAAVPLYHQIFLQLRDEILDGRRAFGAAVPTEQDLSASFAVSRITARRALDELARQHFVARRRRVGTTVIFRQAAKPIEANIDRALDSLFEFGRTTTVRVLRVSREAASGAVCDSLQIPPGEPVTRAVRLRYLDDEPLTYVVSYVPVKFGLDITRARLRRSALLVLIEQAGLRIGNASQTISAMIADPVISRALKVEPRAAVLRISRIVCNTEGTPLLTTIAHYRSDRYHLRIDLKP